jgi:glyoxylase-like metal-dependent hydrolase (beta-lactamase superfamily II)
MKSWFISTAIIPALLALPIFAAATDPALEVVNVSERIRILRAAGADNNIIALNTEEGIVVIDTGISPSTAKRMRRRMEEEFQRRDFAFVINTHYHGDHTYGNQAFADVVIVGHQNAPEQMRSDEGRRTSQIPQFKAAVAKMGMALEKMDKDSQQAKSLAARKAFYSNLVEDYEKSFVLTPPTKLFKGQMGLDLGDVTLQLTHFGSAHTESDILIYCPEESIWFTGDLFAAGHDLYIDSSRVPHINRWMENIRMILRSRGESSRILPGHGDFLPFSDLETKLETIQSRAREFSGKESAFLAFKRIHEEEGMEKACIKLRSMHAQPDRYYTLYPEIDQYAYRLMLADKLDEALEAMTLLADLFPDSDTAFDSLGEVYLKKGMKELAVKNFKKSLELNPKNRNAQAKLKMLQGKN